jgi:hypothetical protein
VQRQGAMDFFWKARMVDLDRDERKIDIHHIFLFFRESGMRTWASHPRYSTLSSTRQRSPIRPIA